MCLAAAWLCIWVLAPGRAWAADAPTISAASAIVIEASTGRVVYEKDADTKRSPASMTKMMTCLLALDLLGRHQDILMTPAAYQTEDCPLEFAAGDMFSAEELVRGMMLVSDNGAAVALAEAAAGSVPAFVNKMNDEARALGMDDTHFANPNGLTNPAHYSTARDMARLARHAQGLPRHRQHPAGARPLGAPEREDQDGREFERAPRPLRRHDGHQDGLDG